MAEIIISSGVTSTGIVAESGDVVTILAGGTLAGGTVKNGAVVNGTFGAVAENLKTEAGATVNLETATGSGLQLKGNATEIAADTLYWNGNVVHGTAAGGVLTGVSSTDPYRFCVGDGITVLNASLTSGTRIYTYGDSLVSHTTILESGNIGMTEADTVGREITVGGAGVAEGKATLQIRGTSYDTVVSEGGRANVYKTASDTEVYAGGFLEVKEGGSAFGAEIHGGSMGVSAGAYASGANVSAGASMVILDGGSADTVKVLDGGVFAMTGDTAAVKDFTVEEGGKFSVEGGTASGALISGANITPTGGNVSGALIDRATVYDMNVNNGTTANSMTVKRATWTNGTVTGGSNSTDRLYVDLNYYVTANNVTFTTEATESATGICLVSAGANGSIYLNDVTVKNFAYLEYAAGVANNLSILDGGFMHQRRNAIVSGVTISGARNGVMASVGMYSSDNRMTDAVIGSGGKLTVNAGAVSGATVLSGGTLSADGAGLQINDLTVAEGGKFYVNGTVASRAIISGATITPMSSGAGVAVVSAKNADIYDMNVRNGKTSNYIWIESATWTGGTVTGGSTTTDRMFVNLYQKVTVNNVTFATDLTQSNYLVCLVSAGANGSVDLNNVTVRDLAYLQFARGTANNLSVFDGGRTLLRASAVVNGAVVSGMRNGYETFLNLSGVSTRLTDAFIGSGGKVVVSSGTAENILVNKGGTLDVQAAGSASLAWLPTAWSGTVTQSEGAAVTQLDRDKAVYYGGETVGLIERADTMNDLFVGSGNSAIIWDGGTVNGMTISGATYLCVSGGVVNDLKATNGATLYLSHGGVLNNAEITSNAYLRTSGGTINGAKFYGGGSMYVNNYNVISYSDIVIGSGGKVSLANRQTGTVYNNITVSAGGYLVGEYIAALGKITGTLTLDLNGAAGLTSFYLNKNLYGVSSAAKIVIADENAAAGNSYRIVSASESNNDLNFTFVLGGNSYALANGGMTKVTDPFRNILWSDARINSQTFMNVTDAAHVIPTVDNAAALKTSGSTLNGSDREAKWTANTTVASSVYLADGMTAGNAWLEIDGATVGNALYGAAANQNFTGVVNLKFTSGSIRNLAAGAAAGGTVKAVNFEMAAGELAGNTYAGGMGNVTGAAKTTIAGGTLAEGKNFYAGALWNKQSAATSVGEVSLTVKAGTIDGNVYGASAVKTGTITTAAEDAAKHTVGNVSFTLAGGTAANAEFCAFAGGYATGTDTTKLASVYKVGDIDVSVTGGTWGDVANGRGLFGGIFASGVKATAEDVTISISGGRFGNVFGGGWAQKGGTSVVDDVEISISGGTIANIFGGGAHSDSQGSEGSTTVVDDVTILVTGGNITGNIFAMGQSDGDAVVGDEVSVIFTGDKSFGCNVWGYSYLRGPASDATLSYTDYTGTFSGEIGGFDGITLDGATAMTLSTAADDVSNASWKFDAAERDATLAGTAFLNWTAADFTGDVITLNLAEGNATAWSLVGAAANTAYGTFDVQLDGVDIATDLALDDQIASGDYAGWGFTVEESVLKFKNLA